MATPSSILAWEILWTEEPGRLQSLGLQNVGHDLATIQHNSIYSYAHMEYIYVYICMCCAMFTCSVMSNSVLPCRLQPARLLCPQDFPGKNTGVGCHFLLQGIFPTQGSKMVSGFFTSEPLGNSFACVCLHIIYSFNPKFNSLKNTSCCKVVKWYFPF